MGDEKSLDFSPFDAEANLSAVNEIVRSLRHISWSYAGDISRVVKKISQSFDAGRCILFAAREGDSYDVYEFSEDQSAPLTEFFASKEGQNWLKDLALQGDSFFSSDSFVELNSSNDLELPDALIDPPSHIVPLKNPYTSRYGIKPGFLLIQEPRGLSRWNKKQLQSILILSDYLAMIVECERLTNAMKIETDLGSKIPGILTRRKFTELAQWELSKAEEESVAPVLVLMGFPQRTRLSLPAIIKDADQIFHLCARSVVEIKSPFDLVGYWRGDHLVIFSSKGDQAFLDRLIAEVRKAYGNWAQSKGVGTTMEDIPAFGIARFPNDGSDLNELYKFALEKSQISITPNFE